MQIERICKHCNKSFYAGKVKQFFCSRKCFKQNYYHLKRIEDLNKFPVYKCPKCNNVTALTFDPSKKTRDWVNFKCPWCYRREVVIEIIIDSTSLFILF